MIPKKIHYCWFGGKPLPEMAKKCIESWQKYMPDYEIIRWDETNFDFTAIEYMKEAYEQKKYAFVSDVARYMILEREGGVYFDTDVEVIADMRPILDLGPYMGIEKGNMVNPGLGMAAEANMPFLKDMIEFYRQIHFVKHDGSINYDTVVFYTTKQLNKLGWNGEPGNMAGFRIYDSIFFCPLDYETNELKISKETKTIHHYSASWIDNKQRLYILIKKIFGIKMAQFCSKTIKLIKR